MTGIGTVINFCSLDARWIGPCVRATAPFSAKVVVPFADRLFDNTPEDPEMIRRVREENPQAEFVPFEYHHSITEMLRPRFWHNYARWVGLSRLPGDCDRVLFLDADEIVETDRFMDFLARARFAEYDHLYFANYWYFREPRFRARKIEDSPALIRRSIITVNRIFHERERATFRKLPNGLRQVNGLDGKPMFHHYSWVMDKERMLRKVRTWGHSLDTDHDWERLVEEEFSREFSGRDFVHGYDFDVVEPLAALEPGQDVESRSPAAKAGAAEDCLPEDLTGLPDALCLSFVDLKPLSGFVADTRDLVYFLDTACKEHYRLLACLSTLFSDRVVFDIGTYKGYSALALAYNPANRIVSYDIVDHRMLNDLDRLARIEFRIGDVLADPRLLQAPLVLLDIGHDGTSERRIYDFLDQNSYEGVLVLDGIHLNAPMKSFWKSIRRPKRDITALGHVTGTGIVFFNEDNLIRLFASKGFETAACFRDRRNREDCLTAEFQKPLRNRPAVCREGAARGLASEKLRIGFHSNQLGLRGTEVALFDYAYYNRALLGNESVIISRRNADLQGLEKFRRQFEVLLYDDFSQVPGLVARHGIDAIYYQKAGANDGKLVPGIPNLVHAVFQSFEPHGEVYAYVSEWLARKMTGGRYPFVPHMVRLPESDADFRRELKIPPDAVVFGRHGGKDQFDIPFVRQVVARVAAASPEIYFLFLNTDRFCAPAKNIIHLNPTWDPDAKTAFINTCDAMLHARRQGETFGLAIAEFLLRDRPVISWADGIDQNHLAMLGDRGLYYRDAAELFDLLTGFKRRAPRGWYSDLVKDCTPQQVMAAFKTVFLDCVRKEP